MRDLVLGESLDALIDYRGKTPKKLGADFTDSGVPVASAILVSEGRLNLSNPRFVSVDTWRAWMSTPTRQGDVLLTSEAPLGRVARVPTDAPLVLGQRLFCLRGKQHVLDNGYLFYALQTEKVRSDLIARSTGTTVFGIRQSALRSIKIPAPRIEEQRAIAEVLGALDLKIDANARTLNKSQDLAIALASTSNTMKPLSEVAQRHSELVDPRSFRDACVDLFSLPAFDEGCRPERVAASTIKSNKVIVRQPCVLLTKLNPRIPRVWDVPELSVRASLASPEFMALTPRACTSSVLWSLLRQQRFLGELSSLVAGTSGSHQRVRPEEVMSLHVIDPDSLDGGTRSTITALGLQIFQLRSENVTLAAARDVLLPLLMSGTVRVKDVEGEVEHCV